MSDATIIESLNRRVNIRSIARLVTKLVIDALAHALTSVDGIVSVDIDVADDSAMLALRTIDDRVYKMNPSGQFNVSDIVPGGVLISYAVTDTDDAANIGPSRTYHDARSESVVIIRVINEPMTRTDLRGMYIDLISSLVHEFTHALQAATTVARYDPDNIDVNYYLDPDEIDAHVREIKNHARRLLRFVRTGRWRLPRFRRQRAYVRSIIDAPSHEKAHIAAFNAALKWFLDETELSANDKRRVRSVYKDLYARKYAIAS